MGANLAKLTIDLMFGAIADHMPDLKPIRAAERLRSGFFNGITHWQVDYRGSSAENSVSSIGTSTSNPV